MKIYIVSGSTGEYSDRTDWMVRAYTSEDEAKRIVEEYSAKAKEVEVRCDLPEDDPNHFDKSKRWHDDFKWPHPDPGFQMDYTGTSYAYGEIELVDREDKLICGCEICEAGGQCVAAMAHELR